MFSEIIRLTLPVYILQTSPWFLINSGEMKKRLSFNFKCQGNLQVQVSTCFNLKVDSLSILSIVYVQQVPIAKAYLKPSRISMMEKISNDFQEVAFRDIHFESCCYNFKKLSLTTTFALIGCMHSLPVPQYIFVDYPLASLLSCYH